MFKIDYVWFGLGILSTLLIGLVVLLVANHRRHCCHSCSRRTKKICRIFVHEMDKNTPIGFRRVCVYVFRLCKACGTVRVHVIDKLMSHQDLKRKPPQEFEFSSAEINGLFHRAPHVRNPTGYTMIRTYFVPETTRSSP